MCGEPQELTDGTERFWAFLKTHPWTLQFTDPATRVHWRTPVPEWCSDNEDSKDLQSGSPSRSPALPCLLNSLPFILRHKCSIGELICLGFDNLHRFIMLKEACSISLRESIKIISVSKLGGNNSCLGTFLEHFTDGTFQSPSNDL